MVHVTSEVGRLRRVLVHEPGPEVDLMAPGMMEELLFDDILFGDRAREEHAIFRRVLQFLGVEVIEARDLLEETLEIGEAREWLLELVFQEAPAIVRRVLREAPATEVANLLVHGLRADGGDGQAAGPTAAGGGPADPGEAGGGAEHLYRCPPLPNWCFQRDPQIVIGSGVALAAMAAPARHLEAMLSRVLFRFHPRLGTTPVLFEPLDTGHHRQLFTDPELPRLEGGDLLVLSRDVVAVGLSERTNLSAVLHLARALARSEAGPRRMLVVEILRRRAYMHLDTLITPVDNDACLVYPPVLIGPGSEEAKVGEIDLRAPELEVRRCEGLLAALARLGLPYEPIPCGGADPLFQQREQWTDGANALAVAPGIILLYDRNVRTAATLVEHGFRAIEAEDLLLGREEIHFDESGRTCVLLPSHELSRARGGPHCLSHPLWRDDPS